MGDFCTKINCVNRFVIGNKNDADVINYICPKCHRLYFYSNKKTIVYARCFFVTLLIGAISLISIAIWHQVTKPLSSEESLAQFFKNINNKNFEEAFELSHHQNWLKLEKFKKAFEHCEFTRIQEFVGKSYYSDYGADTIFNVKYIGAESDGVFYDRNYDFHLKKYPKNWKIIRIIKVKTPGVDILRKEELPKRAEEAVRKFFNYLNKHLYKKAYNLLVIHIGNRKKSLFLQK